MALPVITKTWTITANNRIPYVSLNDTMSKYLFGVKEFLKTNGYTVRGSSDGVTASPPSTLVSDGIDRWVTAANVTTRGTGSGTPQSWIVLRDGAGVDILITYQGPATDDTARVSFSAGQLFTTQATGTFQPTATDEAVVLSSGSGSLIGSTASLSDRNWFGWVDSQSKMCRFAIARAGIFAGLAWGVEHVLSVIGVPSSSPAVWSPPTWGFAWNPGASIIPNQTSIGIARVSVASLAQSVTVFLGIEEFANNNALFSGIKPEFQGGAAFPMFPLSIESNTANAHGKMGNLIDWWQGRTSGGVDGDLYGSLQFLGIGGISGASNGSGVWPWDGTTVPVLT